MRFGPLDDYVVVEEVLVFGPGFDVDLWIDFETDVGVDNVSVIGTGLFGGQTLENVAFFEEVGGGAPPASTPEPSLIFGFITLGGLMLGSKRKNKG